MGGMVSPAGHRGARANPRDELLALERLHQVVSSVPFVKANNLSLTASSAVSIMMRAPGRIDRSVDEGNAVAVWQPAIKQNKVVWVLPGRLSRIGKRLDEINRKAGRPDDGADKRADFWLIFVQLDVHIQPLQNLCRPHVIENLL